MQIHARSPHGSVLLVKPTNEKARLRKAKLLCLHSIQILPRKAVWDCLEQVPPYLFRFMLHRIRFRTFYGCHIAAGLTLIHSPSIIVHAGDARTEGPKLTVSHSIGRESSRKVLDINFWPRKTCANKFCTFTRLSYRPPMFHDGKGHPPSKPVLPIVLRFGPDLYGLHVQHRCAHSKI